MVLIRPIFFINVLFFCLVLLQHGADPNIRNTDGKSALDLADPSAKAVLTGQYLNSSPLLYFQNNVYFFIRKSAFLMVQDWC